MYFVMFAACMYVLILKDLGRPKSRRRPLNKPLVLACVALFMSITTVCIFRPLHPRENRAERNVGHSTGA